MSRFRLKDKADNIIADYVSIMDLEWLMTAYFQAYDADGVELKIERLQRLQSQEEKNEKTM